MKKVIVIRKVPINGRPSFEVRTDKFEGCFEFEIGADKYSIYNEEVNRLKAMALAAEIENGGKDKIEIIYQTPNL